MQYKNNYIIAFVWVSNLQKKKIPRIGVDYFGT